MALFSVLSKTALSVAFAVLSVSQNDTAIGIKIKRRLRRGPSAACLTTNCNKDDPKPCCMLGLQGLNCKNEMTGNLDCPIIIRCHKMCSFQPCAFNNSDGFHLTDEKDRHCCMLINQQCPNPFVLTKNVICCKGSKPVSDCLCCVGNPGVGKGCGIGMRGSNATCVTSSSDGCALNSACCAIDPCCHTEVEGLGTWMYEQPASCREAVCNPVDCSCLTATKMDRGSTAPAVAGAPKTGKGTLRV